jgi:hypothetical protein
MPINHEIAAFWLQYEYVRLDIVGTISTMQDFLDSAREEGLEMPMEYRLDVKDLESRMLPLTLESQELWRQLIEQPASEILRQADNPLEESWYDQEVYQRLYNEWVGDEQGFLLFSSSPQGAPLWSSVKAPLQPKKHQHVYSDRGAELNLDCSVVRGGLGRAVDELLELSVDPRGNAPAILPTATTCNGDPCFTYHNNESSHRTIQWTTTVRPVNLAGVIGYLLNGSRDPNSKNIHTFMR